jgi:hypothetical protein
MDFQTTREAWADQDGLGYRIIRRRFGYYACVQVVGPYGAWWDFAWDRRPYRTFARAAAACRRNRRLWERFVRLSHAKGDRRKQLRELDAKGRSGNSNALGSLPLWVSRVADPSLIRIQFKDLVQRRA